MTLLLLHVPLKHVAASATFLFCSFCRMRIFFFTLYNRLLKEVQLFCKSVKKEANKTFFLSFFWGDDDNSELKV